MSDFHALGIGDEVRREIAAIELHAFDDFELGFERLRLFYGDDAVFADFLHGLGNDLADGLVIVGRDGADLGDHFAGDGLATACRVRRCSRLPSLSSLPAMMVTAFSMPRFRAMGLAPAATVLTPSR